MLKIYFAGPDVFFADYDTKKARIRELCTARKIHPLFPGDSGLSEEVAIFQENRRLISEADAVIAHLSAFMGDIEPDSGTVFECGLAHAQGKPLIGYSDDYCSMVEKALHHRCTAESSLTGDSGPPLNLMLCCTLVMLVRTVDEAVAVAGRFTKEAC